MHVERFLVEKQVLVAEGKSDGSDDAGEDRVGDFIFVFCLKYRSFIKE